MGLGTDVDAIAQCATDAAGAVKAVLALGQVVPAGSKVHDSDPGLRYRAYLEFQIAAWDTLIWAQHLVTIGDAAYKPLIVSRLWNGQSKLIDAIESTGQSLSRLLAAVSAVRLVGNPEPRELAEYITVVIGSMFGALPSGRASATRAARTEEFETWQKLLGVKQREFTLAARRDLGYAAPLREHWWQVRRPKVEAPWPGGWPGPVLTLEGARAALADGTGQSLPEQRAGGVLEAGGAE
jgi:hypothetical protein